MCAVGSDSGRSLGDIASVVRLPTPPPPAKPLRPPIKASKMSTMHTGYKRCVRQYSWSDLGFQRAVHSGNDLPTIRYHTIPYYTLQIDSLNVQRNAKFILRSPPPTEPSYLNPSPPAPFNKQIHPLRKTSPRLPLGAVPTVPSNPATRQGPWGKKYVTHPTPPHPGPPHLPSASAGTATYALGFSPGPARQHGQRGPAISFFLRKA